MNIKLNYINHSDDSNNSSVVIFQKNLATSFDEVAVAWRVIQNCGRGWNHPFTFSHLEIAVSDQYGNFSPRFAANHGDKFCSERDPSGDILRRDGDACAPNEIQLVNNLEEHAVSAHIYRDGKVLAVQHDISFGQIANFSFEPTIWIGVTSQIEEGQAINSAVISSINTELSLLGMVSADIVMTGGGPGGDSSPFQFSLTNVVMG